MPFRILVLAACAIFAAGSAAAQTLPRILPAPNELRAAPGRFTVDAATPVVVPAGDTGARRAADQLVSLLKDARGLTLRPVADAAGPAIRFVRAPTGKAESYRLAVDGRGATVTAGDDAGMLYGAVTLWQALTPAPGKGAVTLSGFGVNDAPRFAWRGLMLDSARHFQSPAYVRRLIDWMAVNKLNTLHWHLVDDQGWRVEIRKYPRLTGVSGWRVPATAPGAPALPKVGGFYTQAEIRAIVAYAAQRNVTIVPEIEMPGHALAAIRAYPALGTGVPIPPGTESDWGVFPWLYNTDDTTFAFLQDVLSEVMDLFPGKYIHIGGDEAVKDQWKASPVIQAKMRALGLKDENALQAWFVQRIATFLQSRGRRMIGWDEILEGDVPADATITSWRGVDGAVAAAKAGHDAILSPSPTLYLNHRQGLGPNEPPGRGAVMDLRTVYAFEPVIDTIPADRRHHILGLQGNLWTEHVRTEARASWSLFPRASAIAETGWSRQRDKDYTGFVDRLVPQMERMKTLGLASATTAFDVRPRFDYRPGDSKVAVTLENQSGLPIRYSLDGGAVTARSPLYSAPLDLSLPSRLRAASVGTSGIVGTPLDRTIDARAVRTRGDEDLKTCTNKVVLALEDDYAARGKRAVFLTDIFEPCWQWAKAPVGGARSIALAVGQLPFNFQIGADINQIKFRKPATPAGEFEVRTGTCQGAVVATLPLAPAAGNPGVTRLVAPLTSGGAPNETLCITYTATGVEPMWALDSVELLP